MQPAPTTPAIDQARAGFWSLRSLAAGAHSLLLQDGGDHDYATQARDILAVLIAHADAAADELDPVTLASKAATGPVAASAAPD